MVLQIIGFVIGLIYLWWEYHADWKVWIASVVMPAISMVIYFSKGLYADFTINIYYLIIAVYGVISWRGHSSLKTKDNTENDKANKKPLPISHTPIKVWILAMASCIIMWYVIWLLLTRFTDSTVPVADAFTTALSIVGLWMMARKYAEQWLIWVVVDFVCSILYFYKDIPFYGVLYAIYTIIAVFGYRKWLRLMNSEINLSQSCDNLKH